MENKRKNIKKNEITSLIITLIIIVLTVVLSNLIKEWLAALVGIGALAVYYVILYFFRDRLRNEFTYEIK